MPHNAKVSKLQATFNTLNIDEQDMIIHMCETLTQKYGIKRIVSMSNQLEKPSKKADGETDNNL